jgi:hypothetical protein
MGRFGKLVERIFEIGYERVNGFAIRLFRARRRHDAATEFAYGLFEKLGIFRDAGGCDAVETGSADFDFIVVAAGAVLLHHGQLGIAIHRRKLGCACGQGSGKTDDGHQRERIRNTEHIDTGRRH